MSELMAFYSMGTNKRQENEIDILDYQQEAVEMLKIAIYEDGDEQAIKEGVTLLCFGRPTRIRPPQADWRPVYKSVSVCFSLCNWKKPFPVAETETQTVAILAGQAGRNSNLFYLTDKIKLRKDEN